MRVIQTIAEIRRLRRETAGSVGFVPTMGALHEGHMSLVRQARADNEHVVASIFVNPSQFGPHEDLSRYPRPLEQDLELLQKEEVDIAFVPNDEEIYPEGFSTWVVAEGVSERLEGRSRVDHFKGVATVVAKLFNIVQPHRAYFGRKDAQQLLIIQKMVRDLNMDVEIVPMPTVREPDGLAMSSRNAYLSPEERRAAVVLYKALAACEKLHGDGVTDATTLRQAVENVIAEEPLARLDYISVADPETLEELETIGDRSAALASLAVYFGRTRLIDNVTLNQG
jgi:pantoate--beta-alanine ligase